MLGSYSTSGEFLAVTTASIGGIGQSLRESESACKPYGRMFTPTEVDNVPGTDPVPED